MQTAQGTHDFTTTMFIMCVATCSTKILPELAGKYFGSASSYSFFYF